jgi:hypothetical protein
VVGCTRIFHHFPIPSCFVVQASLGPADVENELASRLRNFPGGVMQRPSRSERDLTAYEEIRQERLIRQTRYVLPEQVSQQVRDSYLILRRGNESGADIVEYRIDAKGNRLDHPGLNEGYFVTSGFALICNYFSSGFQSESTFRYLGDDTYVVGFAQQPGKATLSLTMRGREGTAVHMLLQGIAWVDRNTFQIIRMRKDLLAPRSEAGLNQQTTEVTLSEIRLVDAATPLWLPTNVKVDVEFRASATPGSTPTCPVPKRTQTQKWLLQDRWFKYSAVRKVGK